MRCWLRSGSTNRACTGWQECCVRAANCCSTGKPDGAAEQLQQALSGKVSVSAWTTLQSLSPALLAPPAVRFTGAPIARSSASGESGAAEPLLVHRSQPLLSLIKSLNDYSNNVFKPLADAAGGAVAVESLARDSVPEAMRSEITLGDGAGTDRPQSPQSARRRESAARAGAGARAQRSRAWSTSCRWRESTPARCMIA